MERAVLLIDGGYFDQVKRTFGVARIDYTKMGDELVKSPQATAASRSLALHSANVEGRPTC